MLGSWGSDPILKFHPTGPINSACYDDRAVGSGGPSGPGWLCRAWNLVGPTGRG
jgi:hypothetical protein